MNRREFFAAVAGVSLAGVVIANKPETIIHCPDKQEEPKRMPESPLEMHMRHWGERAGTAHRQMKEKMVLEILL